MEQLINQFMRVWEQATVIWIAGGWAMIGIAVDALVMFGLGTHIWFRLQRTGFLSVPERRWRRWLEHSEERRGAVGRLLDAALSVNSLETIALVFEDTRSTVLKPFERDLRVMMICVAVATLLGLFGTVTGMLTTFDALATGSGGEKTMAMIASGISEALITTETGLVVALPGLFMHAQLSRRHDRVRASLAHLETVCTQHVYRRLKSRPQARHDVPVVTVESRVVLTSSQGR